MRDTAQAKKIYVQDKVREAARLVWEALEVCCSAPAPTPFPPFAPGVCSSACGAATLNTPCRGSKARYDDCLVTVLVAVSTERGGHHGVGLLRKDAAVRPRGPPSHVSRTCLALAPLSHSRTLAYCAPPPHSLEPKSLASGATCLRRRLRYSRVMCLLAEAELCPDTPRAGSRQAFISVVEEQAQEGREYAEAYVKRLETQRRYLQDTWS